MPLLRQQDLAKGGMTRIPCHAKNEAFPSNMAHVHNCDCTSAKEYFGCPHLKEEQEKDSSHCTHV